MTAGSFAQARSLVADCSKGFGIMPNRYQREIEEILSRMEDAEPKRGPGPDRIRPLQRPPTRGRATPRIRLALSPTLILASVALALIACGIAYYNGAPDLISGVIGLLALISFVVGMVVGWRGHFRPTTQQRQWSGRAAYDVTPTPLRRSANPFTIVATQVRIMRLRWQYRRDQRSRGER